ncbi:helicase associated domain-containing protein [Streptomyces lavendulocolor]|uniref:helicase associated domain-containing protein n=1 Tax=Streptomyces lavendulocolor TaxID=67316 RepID=UPI0033C2A9CD
MTSATVHEGFCLGQWLANQRSYQRTGHRPLPADRAQALAAIDPWWSPPWNLKWQRSYHRARNAADGQPLRPGSSFIDLDDSLSARWLRRQCNAYDELSEEQQQLLAGIGITTEVARAARDHARDNPEKADCGLGRGRRRHVRPPPERPREPGSRLGHRPDLRPGFKTALAHARSWHAEHGHLAAPRDTLHDGYPLGMWLFSQRNRAKDRARRRLPPSPHLTELAAIDPWWNPPWDLHWQRNYYRARDHIKAGRPFDPAGLAPSPGTVLGSWISRACLQYDQLHPDQQQLLAQIGVTPEVAHARTRRGYPWRTAVEHAKAFAETHGHLAVPHDTLHEGFSLGRWLIKQRYRANKTSPSFPAARALTTIGPWWNPPWGTVWQRAYHHARTQSRRPAARRWLTKQRRAWPLLHPHQQHLLTTAGLVAT